jgi:hypothetical protein
MHARINLVVARHEAHRFTPREEPVEEDHRELEKGFI